MLKSKEFYELMSQFEKDVVCHDASKEEKDLWQKQIYYCNGEINNMFKIYMMGYANGKLTERMG